MSDEDKEFDKYESNKYEKLLPINSPYTPQDNINKQKNIIEDDLSIQSEQLSLKFKNLSTISLQNLTKSNIPISNTSDQLSSLSDIKSIETTKSELIQRILDSFKPTLNCKSSSNSTINTSLSFLDETINPCQSLNISNNKIYINFKDENELGIKPHIDDLLEKIKINKKCSCHRMEIIFNNPILNQELSYKQKQSILRIILRRQQIFDRYFS